jgi:hypothetical protein
MPRHPTRSTGRCRNRQTRAVAEFLGAPDDEDPDADRKLPKAISPVDPCSARTAKANKRVQFGYGLNYLIDVERAVIVDVEATPDRTYDDVVATKAMIKRTERARLEAQTAFGRYDASRRDCRACPLKPQCSPNMPSRKITRDVHERQLWQLPPDALAVSAM